MFKSVFTSPINGPYIQANSLKVGLKQSFVKKYTS